MKKVFCILLSLLMVLSASSMACAAIAPEPASDSFALPPVIEPLGLVYVNDNVSSSAVFETQPFSCMSGNGNSLPAGAVSCTMAARGVIVVEGAAFSDQESIQNTEAVDACVSLKIINGYPDETYRPEGAITRAEMAKMICMVLSGGKDTALTTPDKPTFTDVRGTSAAWAEPFIEACRVQGSVVGVSADRFDPSGQVTGTQAAKMLLGALGYAADKEGFTGPLWALSVNTSAGQAGLYEGMDQDPDQPLTRDSAAQMIWNALNAAEVEYVTETVTTDDGQTATKVSRKDKVVGDPQTKLTLIRDKFGVDVPPTAQ